MTYLPVYHHLIVEEEENFYLRVAEHKDIKKVMVILKTAVSSMKTQVTEVLKQFSPYSVIWNEDKNVKVKVCFPFRQNILCMLFIDSLW